MKFDIALIKLKEKINFTPELHPVCLPTFAEYNNLFAAGWGKKNDQQNHLIEANTLNEVELDEVSNSTCKNYWHNQDDVRQVCVGTRAGVCNGQYQ